jgi:hypothetical protein
MSEVTELRDVLQSESAAPPKTIRPQTLLIVGLLAALAWTLYYHPPSMGPPANEEPDDPLFHPF